MFYFHLGKYDSHLFKILLENFYGKNILDRIGAIKNNDNENETEPSVQNVGTQKRADAWLDGDNHDKLNQEYLNENMLGTHRDWKRAAEVITVFNHRSSITVIVYECSLKRFYIQILIILQGDDTSTSEKEST